MFNNYLKLAIKVLLRRKMFTFINLFGISFTLTILLAATTMYTLMVVSNPVQRNLSKSLLIKDIILKDDAKGSWSQGPAMPYLIEKCVKPLKNDINAFSFFSARCSQTTTYLNNQRVDIETRETDENYWNLFTFDFIEGRPYGTQEILNGTPVIVISSDLKNKFFGNEAATGKTFTLNNKNYTIAGVVKNVPEVYLGAFAHVWIPYDYNAFHTEVREKNFNAWMFHVILETSGTSRDELQKKLNKNLKLLTLPQHFNYIEASLISPANMVFETFTRQGKGEWVLIAIVFLFLMLPLINLTSLTVSRIFERSSEIGVRKAFGATRGKMIFQFVYENVIVTILGGILGFAGAWYLLKAINKSGLVQMGSIDFNYHIFIFGLVIIVLFGIVSGIYPSLKMSKLNIVECLKGGKS